MLSFQFLRYLSLQIAHAAELAGLTGIYDTYYRGLSNDTPHPSVVALNHHMDADENGLIRGLRWGSDVLDVENTIMAVCTTTMHTIERAREGA